MIKGLRHVGIVVADLPSMVGFYEWLGLQFLKQQEESAEVLTALGIKDATLTTVKLAVPCGGGVVELLHYDFLGAEAHHAAKVFSNHMHVAFTVERLDEMCGVLVRHGIRFTGPPCVSGHAKVAFFLDPEGNLVELVEMLH